MMNEVKSAEHILKLKNEFKKDTPDVWPSIKKKISALIAASLLKELEGLPDPQGRMLMEIHMEAIKSIGKERIGA